MNWRWDDESRNKAIRLLIGTLTFLSMITMIGVSIRGSHQLIFALSIIIIMALFMKNIWVTLFIWWSCLLFAMQRFEVGEVYMTNIFYGSILYYMVKTSFRKHHIDFFINIVLWVLVANLCYGALQAAGFDFIYNKGEHLKVFNIFLHNGSPHGFMGNSGIMAALCCMCLPLALTRSRNTGWIGLLLFIPLFVLRSSVSFLAAGVVLMFWLWFKVKRWIWVTILAVLLLASSAFFVFFDVPGMERIGVWKISLTDANCHPVVGWGMDSYRAYTKTKPFVYQQGNESSPQKWDNPHNLLISLFFEFGVPALIILGGYLRHLSIGFGKAAKDRNTIALAGALIAFFVVSMGSIPIFLARMCVIILPLFALMEVQLDG